MIKRGFMRVLKMTKKNCLKEDPELSRIATEWNDKFEVTRTIRREITDAEAKLAVANEDFLKVHKEWEDYEKLNGTPK